MKDGIIELDSEFGKEIGFTSDKFDGWLWKKRDYIYISCIESKQKIKGNLKNLFSKILEEGYGIKVPTPIGIMQDIVVRYGFSHIIEEEGKEICDVWVQPPPSRERGSKERSKDEK